MEFFTVIGLALLLQIADSLVIHGGDIFPGLFEGTSEFFALFWLVADLILTGSFHWRSAFKEELTRCVEAHDELISYRKDNEIRKFFHWAFGLIGKEDIVGYVEPTLSACNGPMMRTFNRNLCPRPPCHLRHWDVEKTLDIVDTNLYWPEKTLILCMVIMGLMLVKKIIVKFV